MGGRERSRPTAQYLAARAMFQLLLTAPYRTLERSDSFLERCAAIDMIVRRAFDPC